MYDTFTKYSRWASDSTMDWNICSVIRGIIPLSSSESMSAPLKAFGYILEVKCNNERTIMVNVFPLPVCPYAKTVPL